MNNSEEVSLSFSGFYDGGQLFKSKSTNYWILMTHILNLPPTSRGKLGIGMFLSANYSGRRHMEAEKFLFTDMYCEELRILNDGTGVTGVQDGAMCVYIGHRQLLPQNSYLRFLGQSGTISEEEEEEEPGAVSKKRARLHSSNERNQESSNERNQEASSSVEHPALK
jgi:hypothetical protein